MVKSAIWFFTATLASAAPVAAMNQGADADLIGRLAACRGIVDSTTRLACYDAAGERLVQAVHDRDLVVMDREDVRETRRGLFGFALPRLPLFGGKTDDEKEVTELTAKVTSVRALPNGKWQLKLEDGAIWQTTEAVGFLRDPKAGSTVVIHKGALGGYMMRIDGQRGLRAKRES
jgi:hypothetical protein